MTTPLLVYKSCSVSCWRYNKTRILTAEERKTLGGEYWSTQQCSTWLGGNSWYWIMAVLIGIFALSTTPCCFMYVVMPNGSVDDTAACRFHFTFWGHLMPHHVQIRTNWHFVHGCVALLFSPSSPSSSHHQPHPLLAFFFFFQNKCQFFNVICFSFSFSGCLWLLWQWQIVRKCVFITLTLSYLEYSTNNEHL